MRQLRCLYHLMLADFLERIRRYSFLIVLIVTVLAGYSMVPSIDDPYNAFAIGQYRPYYNSAWVGTVFGLVVASLVSLLGFFLIRNAVIRDYQTRVGQIIATTPISKPLYMLGKWLSNLAVLSSILCVLTMVALIMQLVRAEDLSVDIFALAFPIWFMGFPVLALVAAVALLFESIPVLPSGIGNVVYIFLWGWFIMWCIGPMFDSISEVVPSNDMIGFSSTMVDIRDHMISLGYDPTEGVTDLYQPTEGHPTTRFEWDGIDWTAKILFERLLWLVLAALLSLGAIIPFDRFDPARWLALDGSEEKPKRRKEKSVANEVASDVVEIGEAAPEV